MAKRLCCLLLVLICMNCRPAGAETSFMRYTSDYFGTVSMLRLYDTEKAQETWAEVKAILGEIEGAVSVSDGNSDIARFNKLSTGESVAVSPFTADIFRQARAVCDQTNGLYDPSVYPLVDLWGFSPRFNRTDYRPSLPFDRPLKAGHPVPPEPRYIDALLPLVGLDGIELAEENGGWRLIKHTKAVVVEGTVIEAQLDLGGIAKGYACDRVRELLVSKGYTEGYFICGDSSMTFLGGPEGKPYAVTAGKPRGTAQAFTEYARFSAENTSLATSSDATHAYDADGVHWCHLIDPRTGWPINRPDANGVQSGVASVTLMGKEAAVLDALGTALCVMGSEEALRCLADRDEQMIMALWQSGSDTYEVVTNMPADSLELPDPAYHLAN